MPLTLSEVSLPVFTKGLNTLTHILTKAEEFAKEKGENADAYVTASLAPDMKPLSFQIQVCSNTIKKSIWRLTGEEAESWNDDESTIEQLKARIQKTLDLLNKADPKSVDGKEDEVVEL